MPIIPVIGRRSLHLRLLLGAMYLILTVLGATMVAPFLITLSGSVANGFDYDRFLPVPRFVWSQSDRFCRGLVRYFDKHPRWYEQLKCALPATPAHWKTWRGAGSDWAGADALAAASLPPGEPSAAARRRAADYSEFVDQYPVEDLLAPVSDVHAALFLAADSRERMARESGGTARGDLDRRALEWLGTRWGMPLPSFYTVGFEKSEILEPYWQQSWFPPDTAKYTDFLRLKDLYRHHVFTPGIERRWGDHLKRRGLAGDRRLATLTERPPPELAAAWAAFKAEVAPAAPAVPFAMRAVWLAYLDSEEGRRALTLPETAVLDVAAYNRLAGTACATLAETPFPVPATAPPALREAWTRFVETRWPVRLTRVTVTPATTERYRAFLRERFKSVNNANRMLETAAREWGDFALAADPPPAGPVRAVWADFVRGLPAAERELRCSEMDYQAFLLRKYGTLAAVNEAQGLSLARLEEAFPPFADAYAVTFARNEWSFTLRPLADNYRFILAYLFGQGRAIGVTALLIAASILLTLTVNPMCAYALSRFGLRGKDRILLYLLATMAFPAMISAIPAYLLMRDLGLLNTFFALLLPGAANGMAIFMLKGFFDSLPPELYEAATIDGAKEHQIFLIVTLPLMKPILAINALNAFIAAYNGWEWALIICQKREMWTLAVWMYQANQLWALDYPWIVTAGFVVISIPTLLVFLFCQRIILRGIVIPQMK
jgi:ABC-type glycerol-3-phosphate transport system permease component